MENVIEQKQLANALLETEPEYNVSRKAVLIILVILMYLAVFCLPVINYDWDMYEANTSLWSMFRVMTETMTRHSASVNIGMLLGVLSLIILPIIHLFIKKGYIVYTSFIQFVDILYLTGFYTQHSSFDTLSTGYHLYAIVTILSIYVGLTYTEYIRKNLEKEELGGVQILESSNCRFGTGALHFYCSESGCDVDMDDYCSMWQHN